MKKKQLNNLDKLTDTELIDNIKKDNCSESVKVLIKRHDKLIYDTIHRFAKKNGIFNINDMLDDIYIIMSQSINSFNSKKGTKFSTWLSLMTRFYCLNSNKHFHKTVNLENKDLDLLNTSQNKVFNFKDNIEEINSYVFDILNQMSDKRISQIYKMRYIDGGKNNKLMTWTEIGKRLGISTTYVIFLSEKGRVFLKNKLYSNQCFDKI